MPRNLFALMLSLACIAVPSSTTVRVLAAGTGPVTAERRVVVAGIGIVTTTTTRTFPLVRNAEVEAVGMPQHPASETIAVDQIEASTDPGITLFNAEIRNAVRALDREATASLSETGRRDPAWPVSVDISAKVTAVAPDVIAAVIHRSVFAHHMMKSSNDVHPLLWSLSAGRALTADDLFDPKSRWWTALVPAMLESAYAEPVTLRVAGYDAIDRSQTPSVSPEGVWMKFKPTDSGSFVLAQPLLLSWKTVQPYLRKPFPFDPNALTPVPE